MFAVSADADGCSQMDGTPDRSSIDFLADCLLIDGSMGCIDIDRIGGCMCTGYRLISMAAIARKGCTHFCFPCRTGCSCMNWAADCSFINYQTQCIVFDCICMDCLSGAVKTPF